MNIRKLKKSLYARMPRKGLLWHFSRSPEGWNMMWRKCKKEERLYKRVGAELPKIVFRRHMPFNDRFSPPLAMPRVWMTAEEINALSQPPESPPSA